MARWLVNSRLVAILVILMAFAVVASPSQAAFADPGDGAVHGTLVERGGAPVVNAWVYLRDENNEIESVNTDSGGTFAFDAIPAGRYTLKFELRDRRVQWHGGVLHEWDATFFDLAAAQELTIAETMLPAGRVDVTVVDSVSGGPIPDTCINAIFGAQRDEGCTDENGKVTVGPLHVGPYQVSVSPPDGYLYVPDQRVTVQEGVTTAVRFALTKSATIEVNVRDASTGAPVWGSCVAWQEIGSAWMDLSSPSCSDEDGKIVIRGLPAMNVRLYALPNDDGYGAQWVGPNGGTGDAEQALRVNLVAGQTATAPVALDPPGSISGIVHDDATGAPVAGVSVGAIALGPDWSRGQNQVSTGTDGKYRINGLGPYAWPVHFVDDEGRYAARWSGNGRNRFTAQPVTVTAGANVKRNIRLLAAGVLTGTLRAANGAPSRGSVTLVNAQSGDYVGYGAAGTDGVYRISGLITQSVRVRYTIVNTEYVHPTKVAVEAGQTVSGVDFAPR